MFCFLFFVFALVVACYSNAIRQLDEYLSDDFLFPMTSRLSYASSPESDLDLSPEPRPANSSAGASGTTNGAGTAGAKSPPSPSGRLVKSSSDPSIATQDDLGVSPLSLRNDPAGRAQSHKPSTSLHPNVKKK